MSERAGASADEQAALFEPLIDSTERQIASLLQTVRALRRGQHNYRDGAVGERQVAAQVQQVLGDLGASDWHLLADRRLRGGGRGQLDLILVGPPGVLLLDAKKWRDVRVDHGRLWHGDVLVDADVERALRVVDDVAELLAPIGAAPVVIRPVWVFAGRHLPATMHGRVLLVGEKEVQGELVRMRAMLDPEQVAAVVAALDVGCPPAAGRSRPDRSHRTVSSGDEQPAAFESPALLEIDAILEAAVAAAALEPIESWMTWLHPEQLQLVTRAFSGPARVRGAAGTGKTVVALHRARHLARRPGARVLVTSYVRTLPRTQRTLFARMAPDLAKQVEFDNVHSWASRLLRDRGVQLEIAAHGGEDLFTAAWRNLSDPEGLGAAGLGPSYWWDEIRHVIKGRGLASLDAYLSLVRVGRRTPLREDQRRAVWRLYEEYRTRLVASGLHDYDDLISRALESVRERSLEVPYTAVVVDEVQDLTCNGLRLLHALVGDAPDGLFLAGDGQQSVFPGGFTLSEAGVVVTGRSTVLRRNYRNRAEILRAALHLVSRDPYDDLDGVVLQGERDVETARPGGRVISVWAEDEQAQRIALLQALTSARDDIRLGDMAVLVSHNRQAERWVERLGNARIDAALLLDYDGTTTDSVKVGTYQRAKGLEFACVFLPDHDRAVPPRGADEDADAFRERAELARRCLFVAMTRARDRLWLGARRR